MKSRKKRLTTIAIVFGAIICVGLISGYFLWSYVSQGYKGEEVRLYVDARGGDEALRDSLVSTLGDDYGSRVYEIYHRASDVTLRSGSYVVRPGDRAYELARRIKNRRQDPVRITFNNVRTIDDLAARLDPMLLTDSDALTAAIDSVLRSKGVKKEEFPAYFLPDTYEAYWTASAGDIVDKLLGYHDRFWNEGRRAAAAAINLTPAQVSTLASIVEEETIKADEQPKVARLYLNRLNRGMKLQADPTVKFAVGDFSLRRILNVHLSTPSPYNTYLHAGLPPGPIRIPSQRAIDAVLNAPQHNFIYMCAREDFSGYHNFAADYATHQENARRYRQALDRRNIR